MDVTPRPEPTAGSTGSVPPSGPVAALATPVPPERPDGFLARLGKLSSKPPMIAYLGVLLVLGAGMQRSPSLIFRGLIIVLVYSALDLILGYWRERKWILPSSAWVSGLILSLVLTPSASWGMTIAAPILASLSKRFIRVRRKHVFNPAAFALVLVGFAFPGQGIVSWWGAAWGQLATIIIAISGIVTIVRVKRWKTAAAFVILYGAGGALLLARSDIGTGLKVLLSDGTLLFFSTVMLIEPVTTAYTPSSIRTAYGAAVALLTLFFSLPGVTLPIPDPFLVSLLFGNLGATIASRIIRRS